MLFNQDKTILELCPSAEKDFIIPDGVERVGWLGNTRVSSITIPTSVKQIDTCAFEESYNLKSVICYPIVPPVLGDYGFWGPSYGSTENLFHGIVYVPSVSMNAYLNSGWSRYILEPIPGYDPNPDSAVNEILNEVVPERYEVYGIDGRLVISTTDKAEVQALPKGIYIVNGKKVAL